MNVSLCKCETAPSKHHQVLEFKAVRNKRWLWFVFVLLLCASILLTCLPSLLNSGEASLTIRLRCFSSLCLKLLNLLILLLRGILSDSPMDALWICIFRASCKMMYGQIIRINHFLKINYLIDMSPASLIKPELIQIMIPKLLLNEVSDGGQHDHLVSFTFRFLYQVS